ncbi:hypothetical protein ACSBOB_21005 [Mesorhizobium sp. ASY16-5R]|uniref:hypothetical protein n=1 Tax=Mesorhizobium sp. ASY16-5R TaxID=3445772 RepID=UPI003FA0BE4F
MKRIAFLLAFSLIFAWGQAVADQGAIERLCGAEWGTSAPLVESCIESQQAAAQQLDRLLFDAAALGWREEVERQCGLGHDTDYVEAGQCVAAAIEGRMWEQRDQELARADAWQRPDGVPEQVFVQVKAQCIDDFGLKYSTVEMCVDHGTRGFRR